MNAKLKEHIRKMADLKKGWNYEDAEEISSLAIERAINLVDEIMCEDGHCIPIKYGIFPSTEGGVIFEWDNGTSIEVFKDGSIKICVYCYSC